MKKRHIIENIRFSENQMSLKVDRQDYTWDLRTVSERLAKARDFELEKFQISPSGYGIHWPLLDEDLSIDGLLKAPTVESGCIAFDNQERYHSSALGGEFSQLGVGETKHGRAAMGTGRLAQAQIVQHR